MPLRVFYQYCDSGEPPHIAWVLFARRSHFSANHVLASVNSEAVPMRVRALTFFGDFKKLALALARLLTFGISVMKEQSSG
jgi:hypothetical protein